jgi:hypothetical protein
MKNQNKNPKRFFSNLRGLSIPMLILFTLAAGSGCSGGGGTPGGGGGTPGGAGPTLGNENVTTSPPPATGTADQNATPQGSDSTLSNLGRLTGVDIPSAVKADEIQAIQDAIKNLGPIVNCPGGGPPCATISPDKRDQLINVADLLTNIDPVEKAAELWKIKALSNLGGSLQDIIDKANGDNFDTLMGKLSDAVFWSKVVDQKTKANFTTLGLNLGPSTDKELENTVSNWISNNSNLTDLQKNMLNQTMSQLISANTLQAGGSSLVSLLKIDPTNLTLKHDFTSFTGQADTALKSLPEVGPLNEYTNKLSNKFNSLNQEVGQVTPPQQKPILNNILNTQIELRGLLAGTEIKTAEPTKEATSPSPLLQKTVEQPTKEVTPVFKNPAGGTTKTP